MAANEQPIDDAVVSIKPDLTGFRTALREGLKKSTTNVVIRIPVKVDTRGIKAGLREFARSVDAKVTVKTDIHKAHLATSLRAAVNSLPDVKAKVGVDLDAAGLLLRLRAIAAAAPRVRIKLPAELDIDRAELRARIRAAVAGLGPVRVQAPVEVRVDTRRARSQVRDLEGAFSRLFRSSERLKLVNWGGAGARPINILYGAIAALSPALISMAASAIQGSTALVGLGATAIGVAGTITSVALAFGSVTDYMKQLVTAQKADRQQAATAAAKTVAQSGSVSQAAYAERDAKWAIIDANKEMRASEQALHDARVQAKRDLEDLIEKESDLRRQQQRDRNTVASARANYLDYKNNFFATPEQIEQARLDYQDALDAQSDTSRELKRTRQDLRPARRNGVRNAPGVVAARDRIEQARRAKIRSGDKAAGGGTIGGTAPPSAVTQLAYLRSQLSPAARELADYLSTNQKVFTRLRQMQETAVLPGFLRFLKTVMNTRGGHRQSTLDIIARGAARLGKRVGTLAADLGDLMDTPWFRADMRKINKSNERSFDHVTDAATALFKPIIRMITNAAPQIERFTGWLETIADRFATWIDSFTDRDLAGYFRRAGDEAKKWWKPVEDILVGVFNILTASLPAGSTLIDRLADLTQQFRDWSASSSGRLQVQKFFEFFRTLDYARIASVIGTVIKMTAIFKAGKFIANHPVLTLMAMLAKAYPTGTQQFLEAVTDALTKLMQFAVDHPEASAAILAYISALKGLAVLRGLNLAGLMLPGALAGGAAAGGAAGAAGRAGAGRMAVANPYVLAAVLGAYFGTKGYQRAGKGEGFFSPLDQFRANPNLDTALNAAQMGSPIAWAGYAAGTPTGKKLTAGVWNLAKALSPITPLLKKLIPDRPDRAKLAKDEAYQRSRLVNNLQSFGKDSPVTHGALQDYITARQAAVKSYVDYINSTEGPIAAAKAQQAEDKRSSTELQKLLVQYGWTKGAAKDFADASFHVHEQSKKTRAQIEKETTSFDSMGNALDKTKTKAQQLKDKSDDLKGSLDTLIGDHVIALSTKNYPAVKAQLDMMYATQHALYNPNYSNSAAGADTVSSNNQYLDPVTGLPVPIAELKRRRLAKNRGGSRSFARGGRIYGPGTGHSDSIPAMLSSGEYVMPVEAVKHYGLNVMENMRARRYAKGGHVMPFVVNLPLKGLQMPPMPTAGPGGGVPYTGKVPRGLGAVAGLTARMMAAVIDAHHRFPWARVSSGLRPGAITVTGNKSYHGFGRATDWPASWDLFNYFKAKYGPMIKELIFSPAGAGQVWNGRPHMYTGKVRATHWNHVHLALNKGGPAVKKFDTGGALGPGYTLAYNGTGQTETVRTRGQEQALHAKGAGGYMRLDPRDINRLAAAITTASGNPTVTMDGRRVAEITNRYNYLPAGV
jgi:hypothetical protein